MSEGETLPAFGTENWREELAHLVKVWGKGHLMRRDDGGVPQIVPGSYDAWERAWILLNRAADGTISA